MGELHLEIIRDRLFREFKVKQKQAVHKLLTEKLSEMASSGEGRFIRQNRENPQYGHACIQVKP